jgi:hypothetical protein
MPTVGEVETRCGEVLVVGGGGDMLAAWDWDSAVAELGNGWGVCCFRGDSPESGAVLVAGVGV